MSEKALEYLSQSDYKNGLVAGVSSNIIVAHKFGERGYKQGKINQLHDCGIIYYPNEPYLLCIMTDGRSFEDRELIIRNISQLVYDEFDKNFKVKD